MDAVFTRACACDWRIVQDVRDRAFYADFLRYGYCPGCHRPKERVLASLARYEDYLIYLGAEPVGDVGVRRDP